MKMRKAESSENPTMDFPSGKEKDILPIDRRAS
jgi:hypothetical protein